MSFDNIFTIMLQLIIIVMLMMVFVASEPKAKDNTPKPRLSDSMAMLVKDDYCLVRNDAHIYKTRSGKFCVMTTEPTDADKEFGDIYDAVAYFTKLSR